MATHRHDWTDFDIHGNCRCALCGKRSKASRIEAARKAATTKRLLALSRAYRPQEAK